MPLLLPLLFGLLAIWGVAVWFLSDVPHRRGGVGTWLAAMGMYSAFGLYIYFMVWRRTISVGGDAVAWKHLAADAVKGGFFPSQNGSRPVTSIESVDRVQSGDLMIRFADGSFVLVDKSEYGNAGVQALADRLALLTGKTVGSRNVSFGELASALPADLRADLEKRIHRSRG